MNIAAILALCLLLGPNILAAGLEPEKRHTESIRPLEVRDSIQMTKILDPDIFWATLTASEPKFNISPDREFFVVVTRAGNLSTGLNDFRLILYETKNVLKFVNKSNDAIGSLPNGEILLSVSSSLNENAIRAVQWLDNESLGFVGDIPAEEPGQLYRLDIRTNDFKQLTDKQAPIHSFYRDQSDNIIFLTKAPFEVPSEQISSFLVGTKTLFSLVAPSVSDTTNKTYQFFVVGMEGNSQPSPLGKTITASAPPTNPWISPGGKWAIIALPIGEGNEEMLEKYNPIASHDIVKSETQEFDENTMTKGIGSIIKQFFLMNMQTRSIEPIFDAPTGMYVGGLSVDVHWMPDGKTVILANTFLPLDGVDSKELARRSEVPAIVEYNIQSKEIKTITRLTGYVQGYEWDEMFAGLVVRPDGSIVVKYSERNERIGPLPSKYFANVDGEWAEIVENGAKNAKETGSQPQESRLVLSVRQDMNTPPEILARDSQTGRERIITDLNPQFRDITFARVEEFSWQDKRGRIWNGGLVYPPNYNKENKYPLVIQTYGFRSDTFLMDHPNGTTSAYAAQAFANKDLLVLQLPALSEGYGSRAEIGVNRHGIEAAIDTLDKMAVIDRRRIAVIGFSGLGTTVENMITFSEYDFAAATIADAAQYHLSGYVATFGFPASFGLPSAEARMGAVPWGDDLDNWARGNPIVNTDRIKTPLRIEQYLLVGELIPWWDTYVLLRRQGKPVEFVMLPGGAHQLMDPWQRYDSLQGNVDWFDFWLNDRERTEPYPGTPETAETLAEQYQRWHKLRELQEKSEDEAIKARAWHKEKAVRREQYEQWLSEQAANDNAATPKAAVNQ